MKYIFSSHAFDVDIFVGTITYPVSNRIHFSSARPKLLGGTTGGHLVRSDSDSRGALVRLLKAVW